MTKLIVSISFFCFNILNIYAQWNVQTLNHQSNLFSVDYFSNNDIWVGAHSKLTKTSNGGVNWNTIDTLYDNMSNIIYGDINDIAMFSANEAIACGLMFTANDEIILRTFNGGTVWNYAYLGNSPVLFQYINSIDILNTNAIGVGNGGKIVKSSNSGSNWSIVNSNTTAQLNDVTYLNQDTIFAVGKDIISRSTDAGLNWSSIYTIQGEYYSVSTGVQSIYVGIDYYANIILKSTDFGASFDTLNLPFLSRGVLHCIDDNTVLVSGVDDLYLTIDGGITWEKYNLTGYKKINRIDFLNLTHGVAVGDTGYVILTSNFNTTPTFPIADFNLSTGTFCVGDSLVLTNKSLNSVNYTYSWDFNGSPFSSQYNSGVLLNSSGSQTITLTVSNSNGSTSYSQNINVIGHEINSFNIIASDDTTCLNNFVGFTIPNSQNGVTYQLRNNYTNIGSSIIGNGSDIHFTYNQPIAQSMSFNVIGTKSNLCFMDSLVVQKQVFVDIDNSGIANSCSTNNQYCPTEGITNVTFGSINNTTNTLFRNYFDYSCSQYTTVTYGNTYPISVTVENSAGEYVKVWFDLNNDGVFDDNNEVVFSGFANPIISGNITIPNTFVFNQKIRMRVASDSQQSNWLTSCYNSSTYCGQIEEYGIIIEPSATLPVSNFTYTDTTYCNTTVYFTNTSTNSTSTWWDFGDGDTSNQISPTHIYTSNGNYTATLVSCNAFGCDTIQNILNITLPQLPVLPSCNPNLLIGPGCPSYNKITIQNKIINITSNDMTCLPPMHFMKDTAYHIMVTPTESGLYFTGFIDFNEDGYFTDDESLLFGGNLILSGPSINLVLPNIGADSIPLRMRLMRSNTFIHEGCNISCGDYVDFTVTTSPHPLITDFNSTDTITCLSPDSALVSFINNSKGASSYLWDFGDGDTSSLKTPTHYYTTPGVYDVTLITFYGTNSDTLVKQNYITINQGTSPPIILEGTNNYLYTPYDSALTYQWYYGSNMIQNANTDSIQVSISQLGTYVLETTTNNGCSYSSSYLFNPVAIIDFTASPTTGCGPQTVNFLASAVNATTFTIDWGDGSFRYNWNGTGSPFHNYTPGTYTLKLIGCRNGNDCDTLTKTNYITIGTIKPTPTILDTSGFLYTTSSAPIYQWYLDGNPIPGANDSTYIPTIAGVYSLEVSDSANCSTFSNNYPFTPLPVNFYANKELFCANLNATVNFTSYTTNAISYLWDFGDGNTSTLQHPTHTYNITGNYTVKLYVNNGSGTDSLIKTDYIKIYDNSVYRTITPSSGAYFFCYGENFEIYTSNYNNDLLYEWYDNHNNLSVNDTNYSVSNDGDYYLKLTDTLGCVMLSDTIQVTIDWNCVTPGDADFSYDVNNYDYLPIGLYYGNTGPPRAIISNTFTPYHATDWGISSAPYIKHADCNGDGIIDMNDTIAVNQNYSLMLGNRMSAPTNQKSNDPDFYITTSSNSFMPGDTVVFNVMLGTQSNAISNLYGIAYNLQISDPNFIQSNTLEVNYSNNWLISSTANSLNHYKYFNQTGNLDLVSTRINQSDTSGYGKIAEFQFVLSNNITSFDTLVIDILYYTGIDIQENYPFFNNSQSLEIGLNSIYTPQPLSSFVTSQTNVVCNGDSSGSLSISANGGTPPYSYYWHHNGDSTQTVTNLSAGVYFVTISDATTPTPNTYTDTIVISENNLITGTDVQTACNSYTWIDNVTYTSSTNTPTFTIVGGAVNGCDSLVTLDLTITNNTVTGTDVQTACNSFTWIDNVTYTSSTNTPTFTIVGGAVNGCDSLVTLDLTITNNTVTGTDIQTACNSFTWIDNVTYTSSTNTPTFNMVGGAANGCDSLVTLDLTITSIDTTLQIITDTLVANQSGAIYQWLNCNNFYSPIIGETSQSYIPTISGDYAVEISLNSCVDTSLCENILIVSIDNFKQAEINIFPNPTNGKITVFLDDFEASTQYIVKSIDGKIIENQIITKNNFIIDLSKESSGLYFINFIDEKTSSVYKVIKQ